MVTEEEMRERLREAVRAAGGVRPFARQHQIGPGNLCNILNGRKQAGEQIARTVGLTRVIAFDIVRADAESERAT